jgi:hypothetical protein
MSIVVYIFSVNICIFLKNHLMMAYLAETCGEFIGRNMYLCEGNPFIFIC